MTSSGAHRDVTVPVRPRLTRIATDGQDGIIVTSGNTTEFATALDRLMGDADLRDTLGEAARESVRRHDPAVILDRWERQFTLLERRR
jgi:glycosyltransferase involved in cell wall biosynthesis